MLKRDKYLKKLINYKDTEFIKVITGVRRSGKSTLLTLFKGYIENEGSNNILFLNFEHPDTYGIQDYKSLYEYIKLNVNEKEKVYFLFDEIQEVKEWQKLINGLRVAYDCDIYITGSNATLLSGELSTYLTGRYVEIEVYPFTLSEIIEFKGFKSEREIQIAFNDYLKYGGFPSIINLEDDLLKQEVLKGIYNSVILKDVSLRSNIEDVGMLLRISLYLMDNIGNPISTNNVANYIRSQGYSTSHERVDSYLNLLQDAFIFYKAQRYDIRGKERLKTLGKYYVVDLGLRNTMLQRSSTNRGSQLENIVYLKLKNDGYDVFVGKYDKYEIDFVCFKGEEVKYIQVAYEIPKDNERESKNLLLIKENYEKIIITMNYLDVGIIDGVRVVHIIDFLLK